MDGDGIWIRVPKKRRGRTRKRQAKAHRMVLTTKITSDPNCSSRDSWEMFGMSPSTVSVYALLKPTAGCVHALDFLDFLCRSNGHELNCPIYHTGNFCKWMQTACKTWNHCSVGSEMHNNWGEMLQQLCHSHSRNFLEQYFRNLKET